MPEETTRATVDEYLRRLRERDLEGAVGLFAETLDWYAPGAATVPWTGRRSTRAQVMEFFTLLHEHLVPEEFTVTHIVVDGADAVIIGHLRDTVKATGGTLTTPFAAHVTVTDGSFTRYHLFEDSYALAQAVAPDSTPGKV
ncbi:nuclear transport factor 2 family protein [Streptomyces gobiensis]|uniref:nuclear transport factor 2 family protein n=1 Tax=Streptomyces gobiensis TaxID=2875706 RepID=UPI001E38F06E|nr:nuclear transport factor 2 family protein [Streptomyces gobiensis]UGY94588.1 nuclear transport factor 2 family protein [Streptomyces gobiensis]